MPGKSHWQIFHLLRSCPSLSRLPCRLWSADGHGRALTRRACGAVCTPGRAGPSGPANRDLASVSARDASHRSPASRGQGPGAWRRGRRGRQVPGPGPGSTAKQAGSNLDSELVRRASGASHSWRIGSRPTRAGSVRARVPGSGRLSDLTC